jgi:integrase
MLAVIPTLLSKNHSSQLSDVWSFGVNVALRISDLLSIKMSDIQGDRLSLTEAKTGKMAHILLNSKALNIVDSVRSNHPNSTYLFQSMRSRNIINRDDKPISRQAVSTAFKDVGETIGVDLGTHSMRKTRGFHLYKKTNDIARVMKMLRHSSEAATLRYIGITQDDIDNDFAELVL